MNVTSRVKHVAHTMASITMDVLGKHVQLDCPELACNCQRINLVYFKPRIGPVVKFGPVGNTSPYLNCEVFPQSVILAVDRRQS